MSETKEKVMETFEKVLPELSESEQENLLYFGEGIIFKATELKKANAREQQPKKTG